MAETEILCLRDSCSTIREVAFIRWFALIKTTSGGAKKRFGPPLRAAKKSFAPPPEACKCKPGNKCKL